MAVASSWESQSRDHTECFFCAGEAAIVVAQAVHVVLIRPHGGTVVRDDKVVFEFGYKQKNAERQFSLRLDLPRGDLAQTTVHMGNRHHRPLRQLA